MELDHLLNNKNLKVIRSDGNTDKGWEIQKPVDKREIGGKTFVIVTKNTTKGVEIRELLALNPDWSFGRKKSARKGKKSARKGKKSARKGKKSARKGKKSARK